MISIKFNKINDHQNAKKLHAPELRIKMPNLRTFEQWFKPKADISSSKYLPVNR